MIRKFDKATALLLVDTQKGVNDTIYYGGKNGRRNNLEAEDNIISLLKKWRDAEGQVAFTKHDSREKNSPLKLNLESGEQLDGMAPRKGDIVVEMAVLCVRTFPGIQKIILD